ncbi:MAG: hypothetical protein MAGBODY4_01605 [Candidatus Marinimicrobia bacterium]|nr:hypothetical protein [Candidatus Neomarinimicrobiota bacterium]
MVKFHGIQVFGCQFLKHGTRFRALHRQQCRLIANVLHFSAVHQILLHVLPVLADIGGVNNGQIPILVFVNKQIIHDAPIFETHRRVLRLFHRHLCNIVHGDVIQKALRIRSGYEELPHVGDVENTYRCSDALVLFDNPGILDRHFIAGKIHDFRTGCFVFPVERCLLWRSVFLTHQLPLNPFFEFRHSFPDVFRINTGIRKPEIFLGFARQRPTKVISCAK